MEEVAGGAVGEALGCGGCGGEDIRVAAGCEEAHVQAGLHLRHSGGA